jgi:hypothetical protein
MNMTFYRRRCFISTGVFLVCLLFYLMVQWATGGQEFGANIFILIPMAAALVYAVYCGARDLMTGKS